MAATHFGQEVASMIATKSSAPDTPAGQRLPSGSTVHLMWVKTPSLTQRGRAWLERANLTAFDGVELQRLIRFEKLSLG